METFSALLAIGAGNSPVTGQFPSQRPVTRGFDVFFDLRLNKRLNKQWWGWWFETPSRLLWRHCNEKMHLNIPSVKYRSLCPGIDVLMKFETLCHTCNNEIHYLPCAAYPIQWVPRFCCVLFGFGCTIIILVESCYILSIVFKVTSLNIKNRHVANSFVTGGIGGCRYDNLWCQQWQQSWHHDAPVIGR